MTSVTQRTWVVTIGSQLEGEPGDDDDDDDDFEEDDEDRDSDEDDDEDDDEDMETWQVRADHAAGFASAAPRL